MMYTAVLYQPILTNTAKIFFNKFTPRVTDTYT